ncbi:hypothetical protein MCHI_003947, partial [Candidatus Magnetoovum chiemensis]
ALGANLKQAFYYPIRASLRAAMIPITNTMQTVGIIHIPGVMAGMLIAGASPLKAASYQLVVLYMIVAIALFTGFFTIVFSYKKIIGSVVNNQTQE